MTEDVLIEFLKEIGMWPLKRCGDHAFSIRCLFAQNHASGQDRRPSAIISFNQGESWYRCHGCGKRQLFTQLIAEWAPPGVGIARLAFEYQAREAAEVATAGPLKTFQSATQQPVYRNYGPAIERLLRMNRGEYPQALLNFLESKGVSPATAREWRLAFVPSGYSDEYLRAEKDGSPGYFRSDCLLIPTLISSGGVVSCVGAQARPLDGGSPKYFSPYAFSAKDLLYGQHKAEQLRGQRFFAVEGALDVQHCWQEGSPAVGLFGTELSAQRCEKIKRLNPAHVRIFQDPDKAGEVGRLKALRRLQAEGVPASCVIFPKQPKHCTAQELKELLEKE
jgi:hypothetical protein